VEAVRRRILLITPFAPARDARHGGARAVHGLSSALADRHELVLLHLEDDAPADPDLAARCAAVHTLAVPSLGRWSRRALGVGALVRGRSVWASELGVRRVQRRVEALVRALQPDVVQVEHRVLGEALAAAGSGALRVVTIHDTAASLREFLPVRREGLALAHRLDARAAMREERRILSMADAAVVFSESDRCRLEACVPASTELVTIPLGWDVPGTALDPCGVRPPTLLFVGSFVHPPNVDAALRLAQRILPRVRSVRPDVTLEIVGSSPPPELIALASEAVRVTGDVPSVTPHLDRAAVVVTPIAIGGGVRVKVLEALAAGKAVVASARAVEGLTARPGKELIVADGDAETAAAIVELLDHDDARQKLAGRARAWALRELSWSAMGDRYDDLYDRLERHRNDSIAERGERPPA
jgi:polysaccharide biosynthesis protein PslH